ncbi:MAG TPA: hypothetical protein EYG85_08665 [Crocinitomix sp.]|nr:hypothetical protein [Crocinitomix sp.]
MKKIIIALVFLPLIFTACKKDYVCECHTLITSGNEQNVAPIQNYAFTDMKKQAAVDSCNAKDYYSDAGNEKITTNCTLK